MDSSPTQALDRHPAGQIPIGVALAAYERAARMSPHDAQLHQDRAKLLTIAGRLGEAYNNLGATLQQLGRASRLASRLFDTEGLTRVMESAYRVMLDRCLDGLPPDHLEIGAAR